MNDISDNFYIAPIPTAGSQVQTADATEQTLSHHKPGIAPHHDIGRCPV